MTKLDTVKEYIINYHKEFNKIPKIRMIVSQFKIPYAKAVEIYRILEYGGFLKRNYNQYKPDKEMLKPAPVPVKEKKKVKDIQVIVIRILMAIVGAGASILSIYYTANWLIEFLPFYLAVMLSTIMIIFSVMAFETIIILIYNKQYGAIFIFSLLWFIVLIFSMVSTVAGQYNQRIKNESIFIKENVETTHQRKQWQIMEDEEKEIKKRIDENEESLAGLNKLLQEYDMEMRVEKNWIYKDTYKKAEKIKKQIVQFRSELKEVRERKRKYLEQEAEVGMIDETSQESLSFYVWMSKIFGAESMYIEFWLYVFPSVFVDIIAPISIAAAMFLKKKEKSDGIKR